MSMSDGIPVLLDPSRSSDLTEIGVIDGGEFVDVLVVSYGATDRTLRIRYEETGNRTHYDIPAEVPLEYLLKSLVDVLATAYPFRAKPRPTIYRGRQARKWMKCLLQKAERMAEALPPTDGIAQRRLLVTISPEEMFGDPNNN